MYDWLKLAHATTFTDNLFPDKDQTACDGYLQIKNCTLVVANVDYPVNIDGQKNTIILDPSTDIFDDTLNDISPIQDLPDAPTGPSTLAGLYLALSNQYDSRANTRWGGAVNYELTTTGATANRYVQADSIGSTADCTLAFTDPMQELLAAARQLMFRTAIAAANGTNIRSTSAIQTMETVVYHSHYGYFVGAAIITLLAVVVTLPTFHGYWLLGRNVSMSPLETGRALGAPLLSNTNSNAPVDELVKGCTNVGIKYGVASSDQLQIAPNEHTMPPHGGQLIR